jgi:hypothetical protein
MWTGDLIMQAIGWVALISGFPLIFIYVRKISRYFAYMLFPRDMLIQYRTDDNQTESYLLSRSPFKGKTLTKLSTSQAESLGGRP